MRKKIRIITAVLILLSSAFASQVFAISSVQPNLTFGEFYDLEYPVMLYHYHRGGGDETALAPSVQEAYKYAVNLIEQYDATVRELNALNVDVTYIVGTIVSNSPFTIEYDNPKSEYKKVGDDYIKVTTYYHAIINNPNDGECITLFGEVHYKGHHILTGSSISDGTNYLYYSSCGNKFYELNDKRQRQYEECLAAVKAFDEAYDGFSDETSNINNAFDAQYGPVFAGYRQYDAGRPMVECLLGSQGSKYSTGPTVFKIGCPAYINCEGELKAIEYDSMSRPKANTVPVISNGSTMVPVRPLIDGLTNSNTFYNNYNGVSVVYNGETKKILVQIGNDNYTPVCMRNTTIELTLGSTTAYLNGEPYEMAQSAQIINGKTMIPLRAVGEMLNCNVEWIQAGEYIVVTPMSLQEFENSKDEFLGSLSEIEIDGNKYKYVECDENFFGASYIIPTDYIAVERFDENSYGNNFVHIIYGEKINGQDYEGIIMTDASEMIGEFQYQNQFWWVSSDVEPQLTKATFCDNFNCYEWVFDSIVVGREDEEIYYLSIENGIVTAVTNLRYTYSLDSFVPIEDSSREPWEPWETWLDPDLLQQESKEFYEFLSNFQRPSPVG